MGTIMRTIFKSKCKQIELIISEPFGFKSSTGANTIFLQIVERKESKIICKCISEFENMSDYLLLTLRNNASDRNYNIYKIPNGTNSFLSLDYGELEFIMIGTMK